MSVASAHPSSFRDPAGFIFEQAGILYRQINAAGQADYDQLMASGLYDELVNHGLLITHQEVTEDAKFPVDKNRYKIIRPQPLPFISYPYEWTFSQLKDAALLTLRVQYAALSHGLILKDASAYNVQFIGTHPVFIDTLSFKRYTPGDPWLGYKQFCEHFVTPLALASYTDPATLRALRVFLDGIPLAIAASLLPTRTHLKRGLFAHIYLHSASHKRYDGGPRVSTRQRKVSTLALNGLLASLERTIRSLEIKDEKTQWSDYYQDTNYSTKAFRAKQQLVAKMLASIKPKPKMVWDLGANDGTFTELAAQAGAYCVAFDMDTMASALGYRKHRQSKWRRQIQPVVMDLTNPSPALGWAHNERLSLAARGPANGALALALIHHLAIGNNLPFSDIAAYFARITKHLIIEFIPKTDSKVQILLASREDIFGQYDQEHFEKAFAKHFKLKDKQAVRGSQRVIYLYQAKAV